jgi:hypothetical protein
VHDTALIPTVGYRKTPEYDRWETTAESSQPARGVVTLSEIGTIWTINQQAKPLKTLASKLVVVGEFH